MARSAKYVKAVAGSLSQNCLALLIVISHSVGSLHV